uniref:HSF1 protein n=1 Tax=Schistosoma curassoni TaxID=6186 RepID=A0A183KQV8_9TREM
LRNHPCFGDATALDGLISQLRTELENDCSLHGSSRNRNFNETAVIQDPLSGPVLSISETCPVVDSNPIIPETVCAHSDLFNSQKEDALLNVHEIVAVTAHEETENKLSSALNAAAPNGVHHSAILFVLPGNMSDASNDNQEPSAVLMDADYHSDPLYNSDVPNKFDHSISEESNSDLISSVVDPHHPASSSRLSIE